MSRINPFLWFDTQAEEAANFYVSVFPNSKVRSVARYPSGGPAAEGAMMQMTKLDIAKLQAAKAA